MNTVQQNAKAPTSVAGHPNFAKIKAWLASAA
jgi:hypothetical protein